MFLRKYWRPLSVFIVAIAGVGIYLLATQPPKEPIVIYKTVTPIKRSETPTAEARTLSASMATDETAVVDKNAEMPARSDASEYAEFSRAELLERFPQYDIHSPESKENLHAILRNEEILKAKDAKIADLKRQLAQHEALEVLVSDLQSSVGKLQSEYPDVLAFREKYPNPDKEDFIREYPDETERRAFMLRTLEASKIQQAMAERILETPGAEDHLPSELLSEMIHLATIDIDKIIGGAK